MKNIITFTLSSLLFILINSCDKLATKDIDVPLSFEVFQEISVPTQSYPSKVADFEYDGMFDIFSHPDVTNAIGTRDLIKKIKITKIQYEFKNFSGNTDAVIKGDIILPEESFSSNIPLQKMFEISNVKVAEAVLTRELYTLQGNFNDVNEHLTKSTIFEYGFAGISTHNPVKVWMVLKVSATVTVEATIDWQGNYTS